MLASIAGIPIMDLLVQFRKFTIALSCYCLLPGIGVSAAGTQPIVQQPCHSCHTLALPTTAADREYCQRCHQAGADLMTVGQMTADQLTAGALQPVDLNIAAVLPQPEPTRVLSSSTTALSPGMTLPMYADESRRGAKPNEMVLIAAGPFIMGSDSRLEDEGPQHTAETGAYWIDRFEVTNAQYQQFIDAVGHRSPSHFRNRSYPPTKADHPVTFVSWYDAQAYCQWAGKRLPTEQEWEKAARGTDGRTFPWGNQFELHFANTPVRWAELRQQGLLNEEIGDGDTTPVGAFVDGASPYGLFDMSGNVWEWVADWYGPHPGNSRQSENYGQINKVLKGGSWWDCSFYQCGISAPTFNRSFFNPKVRNSSFGFRCAKDG